MAVAHTPQRTCLGCGLKTAQQQLLRLALVDEHVVVDHERRLPGRGGYICPQKKCAELLRRKKGLHHGFRTRISEAAYADIILYMEEHATH